VGVRDALASLLRRRDDNRMVEWLGPTFREMILGLTAEELYRTQPHLRIVLSFVARNVAHLGLPVFERVAEDDRRRLTDDPLAMLLRRPNATMTRYELIESLVSDLGLYDMAYWFVYESADAPSGWVIQPIPPSWVVEQRGGTFFDAKTYVVQNPDGTRTSIAAEDLIVFHGWNPGRPKHGASPVETLKQILAEQVQAWSYRQQVWQRGGRVGAYITRPAGVQWSDSARERFTQAWKERWTGMDGAKAGGTPILEDGMTLGRLGFSAREDEWAEVSKVALSTVAAVYHVNPVMVGILDNANFSNTKEFRKMLYSETLGPLLAMIEGRLNAFLVPRVAKAAGAYVEFNIEEKLQGDFEEQAVILSTSAGAPWMTRNEVRALRNLPAIDGGDTLVVPLNVLTGGQASPHDSGEQNRDAGVATFEKLGRKAMSPRAVKSKPTANEVEKAREVLAAHFARQGADVRSRLGADRDDWWDGARWDRELTDDLLALSLTVTVEVARRQLERLGEDPDAYDSDRTLKWLAVVAADNASSINAATRIQVEEALQGEDVAEAVAGVFEVAESSRAEQAAATVTTTLAAFATVESAGQVAGPRTVTKTWVVTSSNPRASHAAMNGESVGIDDVFSNGAKWPGDSGALDVDEIAGCTCEVVVDINF